MIVIIITLIVALCISAKARTEGKFYLDNKIL